MFETTNQETIFLYVWNWGYHKRRNAYAIPSENHDRNPMNLLMSSRETSTNCSTEICLTLMGAFLVSVSYICNCWSKSSILYIYILYIGLPWFTLPHRHFWSPICIITSLKYFKVPSQWCLKHGRRSHSNIGFHSPNEFCTAASIC